ncbi:MAG: WYL domain-containing protein [Schleiferiaceae bacterium]|nr:WYL domain-containing protein [Schleiferiaceae bacterium]
MPLTKKKQERLELLHQKFVAARNMGLSRKAIEQLYMDHDYDVASSTITADLKNLEEELQARNEILSDLAIIEEKLDGPGSPKVYRYSSFEMRLFESEKSLSMEQRLEMKRIIDSLNGFGDYAVLQEIIPQLQSLVVQQKGNGDENEPRKIIEPEFNLDYEGREHVPNLFNAINSCQQLQITYKPFEQQEATEIYCPLYLKQFNQRWFLVVEPLNHPSQYKHLSLDRIVAVLPTGKTFLYPINFDPEDYFHDVVGVTINSSSPVIVDLRVKKPRAYYIRTKPIHKSQKEVKGNADADSPYIEYRIRVIPNKELYATLLEFGPDLEVLTPDSVREEMRQLVSAMYKFYL